MSTVLSRREAIAAGVAAAVLPSVAESTPATFWDRIRAARLRSGMTEAQAAAKASSIDAAELWAASITAERWSEIEAGDDPKLREGMAVCRALDVSPDWVFGLEEAV